MKNKYFTERERYQLEALLKTKTSIAQIAKVLGKARQTIYNEIKRGQQTLLDTELREYTIYCADVAQRRYEEIKTNKGIDIKAKNNQAFISYCEALICRYHFSPYAVSIMLKDVDVGISVCETTIYNYIKRGLFPNVKKSHTLYRKKKQNQEKVTTICIHNVTKPSIEDRDKAIYKRDIYGHWELDTVYSGKSLSKACLLVLTERMTREEIVLKMPNRKAETTIKTIDKLEKRIGKKNFRKMFKTITCDNGTEFSDYEGITKGGRTKLYYCHPYTSCERGSNENANKLIRRWIPKGADISKYTDEQIEAIQDWINDYPRKLFKGMSSNEFIQYAQCNATCET